MKHETPFSNPPNRFNLPFFSIRVNSFWYSQVPPALIFTRLCFRHTQFEFVVVVVVVVVLLLLSFK